MNNQGLSFECGLGLHSPVCNGRNCRCGCHTPTEPMTGMHEPRWALIGADMQHYIYQCQVRGCHREQFMRIGTLGFPGIGEHTPEPAKPLFDHPMPVIKNRQRIIKALRSYLRDDPQ